jgi:hypothetical protein
LTRANALNVPTLTCRYARADKFAATAIALIRDMSLRVAMASSKATNNATKPISTARVALILRVLQAAHLNASHVLLTRADVWNV